MIAGQTHLVNNVICRVCVTIANIYTGSRIAITFPYCLYWCNISTEKFIPINSKLSSNIFYN